MSTRTVLQNYITSVFETNALFAEEVGVSESYVEEVVADTRTPSVRQQIRWAKALGTTKKTLFEADSYLRERI